MTGTSIPRLLPSRDPWHAVLGKHTSVLSMDVFGVALQRLVLDGPDLHELVGAQLSLDHPWLADGYAELRARAEQSARAQAADAGHLEVPMARIADHLAPLVSSSVPPGILDDPDEVTRLAVTTELDLWQSLCRPDPEAMRLYERARQRSIGVAFVADSHLPRDLVGRLLREAGYRADQVLVSSHEGVTKDTGLFTRLMRVTGSTPSGVTHLGPDPELDVAVPRRLGMRAELYPVAPRNDDHRLLANPACARRGIDSIALALAESRFRRVDPAAPDPADLGFYAGGPLALALATWIGHIAHSEQPHRILLCGPAAPVLGQAMGMLLDRELVELVVEFPTPDPHDCPATHVEELSALLGSPRPERLLMVDIGLTDEARQLVLLGLRGARPGADVVTASIAPGRSAHGRQAVSRWELEMPGVPDTLPVTTPGRVVQALLGSTPEARPAPPQGAERYLAAQLEIRRGVRRFVEEIQPWLTHGGTLATSALLEPARRILAAPTGAEAAILGSYPTAPTDGIETDAPTASALAPPIPASTAGDDQQAARFVDGSPWPAASRALVDATSSAPPRRSRGVGLVRRLAGNATERAS